MLPSRHVIISIPLGAALGFLTQSLPAGLLCFLSGTAIDFDHIIDHAMNFGLKDFSFKKLYQACISFSRREDSGIEKLYLFFHSGELAILFWLGFAFINNIYLLAIALGYTVHLLIDVVTNILKPESYFISYRIKNGFSVVRLIKPCSNSG